MLHVHPEADPGHDDDEDGGDVGLDQVEANTAMQPKLSSQTAVVPWGQQSQIKYYNQAFMSNLPPQMDRYGGGCVVKPFF